MEVSASQWKWLMSFFLNLTMISRVIALVSSKILRFCGLRPLNARNQALYLHTLLSWSEFTFYIVKGRQSKNQKSTKMAMNAMEQFGNWPHWTQLLVIVSNMANMWLHTRTHQLKVHWIRIFYFNIQIRYLSGTHNQSIELPFIRLVHVTCNYLWIGCFWCRWIGW